MSLADPVPAFTEAVSGAVPVPEPGDAADSLVLEDLTEDVDLRYHAVVPPGPGLGDHNTYDSTFSDAEGTVLGTLEGAGWKVLVRESDGHLMSFYTERAVFPDGEIRTTGWVDVQAILEGKWQSLYAVGISGRYLGLVGTRDLKGEIPRKRFRANFKLYRQG
ncbi:hypothetical protein VA596_12465 [Amycolatopsis sp., V23-08]|uniref:Allene oxide cyclase barrel-like domain-containing protein n=1 Tax=Amycolatopsis heterodermiae TaxID=3110235 RepID=A0ABU5R2D6_9PSEU|nr:hypothetical protein [Amycolatopsis sp., V23-08]MEA5360352.1 hypothetical protein [Amycolatopsis sp., V23-08]